MSLGGQGSGEHPGAKHYFPWGTGNPTFYLVVLAFVAVIGIAFVAVTESTLVAVATGLASFMIGGIFGFLFGIPRYAASSTDKRLQEGSGVVKYQANTNLEQISDWLTKILVGVGLTQFRVIGSFFHSVSRQVGHAMTGTFSINGAVAASSLMLLTSVAGFLFFYLWSRVYLPRIFHDAEEEKS
jgi:hypothetical protein